MNDMWNGDTVKEDKLDTAFICGAVWAGPVAAAVNFSNALRGATPEWYNTVVSALLLTFWSTWLIRYRGRRGYLLVSLWLTVGFAVTTILAMIWKLTMLPLFLQVSMYLGVALFFIPYGGLMGWIKESSMLYGLLSLVSGVSLMVHGYFLYCLKKRRSQ